MCWWPLLCYSLLSPINTTPLQTSILIDEMGSPHLHICNIPGRTSQYLAPEHYFEEPETQSEKMTTKSDVYSLSMVIVGVCLCS